jgi:alpha/beta superfamily hydrolase
LLTACVPNVCAWADPGPGVSILSKNLSQSEEEKFVSEEHVFFGVEDLKLEGMYYQAPEGFPRLAAVICHPHPVYGGTMGNNVVMAVSHALQETGHSTLRFNFRGVGRSEGQYSGGMGEIEDVRAAMNFVREKMGHGDTPIILAGYSFGSWIAANSLAGDHTVSHLILVAPPTSMFDFSILNKDTEERARHFIVGDRDQFCDRETLQTIFVQLPEPKSLRVVPHTDHFFFAHEKYLEQAVKEALTDHLLK